MKIKIKTLLTTVAEFDQFNLFEICYTKKNDFLDRRDKKKNFKSANIASDKSIRSEQC